MTLKHRLLTSFAASALGPIVTTFVQLVNVPIMLRVWGAHLYGEWLLISTIPAYLLLTDLGFGNVAGNDMTIRANRGDKIGALESFQSIAALVMLVSFFIGALSVALVLVFPIDAILHLSSMSRSEARVTLLLLSANCLVILQWSVLVAAFRSDGRYALGMLIVNLVRVAEGMCFLLLLLIHAGPSQLAALMLFISLVGTIALVVTKQSLIPWLPFGFRHATIARVHALAKPAFAFMAFPMGSALSLQGTTLVVGVILGPLAVALFNPMRTLSRTIFQLTDAVKNAVWPELSAAYGREDLDLARKLHRASCQASLGLASIAAVFLLLFGPTIFSVWTRGRIQIDSVTFYLLLAVAVANSGWNASSAVPLAANRHQRLALLYLASTCVALVVAYCMAHLIGLPGAAIALLFCDSVMSVFVVNMSNRLVADDWYLFLASMFDMSSLHVVMRPLGRWRRQSEPRQVRTGGKGL